MIKSTSKLSKKDLYSKRSVEFDKFIDEVKSMIEIEEDYNTPNSEQTTNH